MGKRNAKPISDKDSPVYSTINEVHAFVERGLSDSAIADLLDLELQEVIWIRRDAHGYQKAQGVEPKCLGRMNGLPMPMEIQREAIRFRLANLEAKRQAPAGKREDGDCGIRVCQRKKRRRGS